MKFIKNKSGKGGNFSVGTVLAIFLFLTLAIFFFGGGVSTIIDITKFLKTIPIFIWIALGVLLLLRMGKK